jgi:flagellar protein FliS
MSDQVTAPRAYRQAAVLSASPVQLVVELYDAACRFLRRGATAMGDREIETAHNALQRAEQIISHLNEVIDDDQGEVSANLHALYAFCMTHLNEARITQDPSKVEDVLGLLRGLRDAWQQVARA